MRRQFLRESNEPGMPGMCCCQYPPSVGADSDRRDACLVVQCAQGRAGCCIEYDPGAAEASKPAGIAAVMTLSPVGVNDTCPTSVIGPRKVRSSWLALSARSKDVLLSRRGYRSAASIPSNTARAGSLSRAMAD